MVLKQSRSLFDKGCQRLSLIKVNEMTLNSEINIIKEDCGEKYTVSHFMSLNVHGTWTYCKNFKLWYKPSYVYIKSEI